MTYYHAHILRTHACIHLYYHMHARTCITTCVYTNKNHWKFPDDTTLPYRPWRMHNTTDVVVLFVYNLSTKMHKICYILYIYIHGRLPFMFVLWTFFLMVFAISRNYFMYADFPNYTLHFHPTVIQRHQGVYFCSSISPVLISERVPVVVQGKKKHEYIEFALLTYFKYNCNGTKAR